MKLVKRSLVVIVFANKDLQRLCEDERRMKRELGKDGTRKLKARLSDILAARVMTDVKRGHPHPLTRDRKGCLGLYLDGGRRLVLEPADDPHPVTPDGTTDWSQVQAVRVVFIGDYHD